MRKDHPLYAIWLQMRDRCNNPNSYSYKYCGARGIKVCKEWNSFDKFVEDMGERPNGASIDRIDNTKGYYKENCRWATREQQDNNRSNHKYIKFAGLTLNIKQWASLLKISDSHYITFRSRLRMGWKLSRAACTPLLEESKNKLKKH